MLHRKTRKTPVNASIHQESIRLNAIKSDYFIRQSYSLDELKVIVKFSDSLRIADFNTEILVSDNALVVTWEFWKDTRNDRYYLVYEDINAPEDDRTLNFVKSCHRDLYGKKYILSGAPEIYKTASLSAYLNAALLVFALINIGFFAYKSGNDSVIETIALMFLCAAWLAANFVFVKTVIQARDERAKYLEEICQLKDK